ncbi:DNA ligase [Undibacterium sp.]|uniref:DNA ligase n=1 Tax=Undibacterium sp. TaxID=1914977 RepID=UPI0025F0C6D4|nr:DNA ligase [Undibacterium sp.]
MLTAALVRRRRLCVSLFSLALPLPMCTAAAKSVTSPPALPLAQNYSAQFDPSLYLLSEKLDGVRAYWDGSHLRFRSGRLISAPPWFTAALPAQALDGELWMGHQTFERLSAAVRRQQARDEEWRAISYQLYELPEGAGDFRQRLASLQALVTQAAQPWLQLVVQEAVQDHAAVQTRLTQIVQAGGEGLMLHRADALWQSGRSAALLKLKPQFDAEAIVLAHEAGKGKYQGMLGALLVQTENGQRLRLGSGFSDAQRRDPPAIGSTISYRYRGFSNSGLPKFASYLRLQQPE